MRLDKIAKEINFDFKKWEKIQGLSLREIWEMMMNKGLWQGEVINRKSWGMYCLGNLVKKLFHGGSDQVCQMLLTDQVGKELRTDHWIDIQGHHWRPWK